MADQTYTADYMKRIAFLDGQVLHDFHLNILQKNIAEAIKTQTTRSKYDIYLLISPYNQYFSDPFINNADRDPASTAVLNQLTFSFSAGAWESTLFELPVATNEFCLVSNYEDYPAQGAFVKFYYRTAVGNSWVNINPDEPVYQQAARKYIQIKIECVYTGTIRPTVYDYALLWK